MPVRRKPEGPLGGPCELKGCPSESAVTGRRETEPLRPGGLFVRRETVTRRGCGPGPSGGKTERPGSPSESSVRAAAARGCQSRDLSQKDQSPCCLIDCPGKTEGLPVWQNTRRGSPMPVVSTWMTCPGGRLLMQRKYAGLSAAGVRRKTDGLPVRWNHAE